MVVMLYPVPGTSLVNPANNGISRCAVTRINRLISLDMMSIP